MSHQSLLLNAGVQVSVTMISTLDRPAGCGQTDVHSFQGAWMIASRQAGKAVAWSHARLEYRLVWIL